jgi:hypothetical protein
MILNDTTLEFSTGRKVKTADGCLSLLDGWVCAGATESVYDPKAGPDDPLYLTPGERIELAEYMIEKWREFTEKVKEK